VSKAEEIKLARITELSQDSSLKFIQFKGLGLMSSPGTHGYIPLRSDDFSRLAYQRFLGISKNGIEDLLHAMRVMAPDRSELEKYVCFRDQIWDAEKLEFTNDTMEWVYSTDLAAVGGNKKLAWNFLVQLAMGDESLAKDYLQAMAPLFMLRKPTGVVWFVGSGSNGKSSLINALYRIIGQYFTSMTTSAIEDGRDTPRLNGVLGNICRESSESRVEDTERYKAIGTHEPFTIHKFHSQDTVEVKTNFHTIFNANNIPVFSDKTRGARRRTLILPFPAQFKDDPSFDDRTFTPSFLSGLIELILEETHVIRDNGYRYKWSDATMKAKDQYDSDVNSAESFFEYLKDISVVGFYNYSILKNQYDTWCASTGLVALGITTLKRTMANEANVVRRAVRLSDKVVQRYQFAEVADSDLEWNEDGYGFRCTSDAAIDEKIKTPGTRKLSEEW
jgi:phage/plasmid-associated DNA primase